MIRNVPGDIVVMSSVAISTGFFNSIFASPVSFRSLLAKSTLKANVQSKLLGTIPNSSYRCTLLREEFHSFTTNVFTDGLFNTLHLVETQSTLFGIAMFNLARSAVVNKARSTGKDISATNVLLFSREARYASENAAADHSAIWDG